MTHASSETTSGGEVDQLDLAADLRLLATLHDRETSAEILTALKATRVEDLFDLPLAGDRGLEAFDFLEQALAMTDVTKASLDEIAADHAAIYLTHAHRVSPSESPWIDPEGLFAQAPMFAVREWYRHWGVEVPDWRSRPDDHLVVQLTFLAHLLGLTDNPHAAADAARFLDRHLLRWIGPFSEGVATRCREPWWAALAHVTAVYVKTLRDHLAVVTGVERVAIEPIEAEKQRLREEAAIAAGGPTCGSPAYVPGVAPSW